MAEKAEETFDFWKGFWNRKQSPWHLDHPNNALLKYTETLFMAKGKVLVPFCGKSLDLKWLYESGHEVVGVEISGEGIKEFFNETKLEYSSAPFGENGVIHQTPDKRLTILETNFFTLNHPAVNESFDYIWDRASLVAVRPEHRTYYADSVKGLVKRESFAYLLQAFEYDQSQMDGPPFSVTLDLVGELFGDFCTISQLDSGDSDNVPMKMISKGLDVKETNYILKPKA